MRRTRYVPERGDIVWLSFDPTRGHEQGGVRPALVLSRSVYNKRSDLAVVCPVTSQAKGYDFEVALPATSKVRGIVLTDHIRTLDWRARKARLAGRASAPVVWRVGELVSILAQGA